MGETEDGPLISKTVRPVIVDTKPEAQGPNEEGLVPDKVPHLPQPSMPMDKRLSEFAEEVATAPEPLKRRLGCEIAGGVVKFITPVCYEDSARRTPNTTTTTSGNLTSTHFA